ncbi:MAG: hypothetical protein R2780_09420 [Crocinitomicaceae bacterium]
MALITEQDLFEIKQKFLREIPHPKLIQKQIDRLKAFHCSEYVEHLEYEMELMPFMESYLGALMPLKLRISNAQSGDELLTALAQLQSFQLLLIKKLSAYYIYDVKVDDGSVKQSDPFDVYLYMKELQLANVKENEIKDYLWQQFAKNDPNLFSDFAKGVLRARKIEGNE